MLKNRDSITRDPTEALDVEQVELRGFAKSITEIQWLLLLLVAMYFLTTQDVVVNIQAMQINLVLFGVFVIGFNFINAEQRITKYKLLIESFVMLAFICTSVYLTGGVVSPLLTLFMLVIITSAITLSKLITFLQISLIAIYYLWMVFSHQESVTLSSFAELFIYFAPFILVAYFTTLLVADMHYGRRMFKALSELDEMTSLLNKRSFNPLYNKAVEVAARYGQPLTVMMIDADNLKQINDTLGHKAGDALIRNIASGIQECLRSSDVTCRYGGDEFVVLLSGLTPKRSIELADRIRRGIEGISFQVDAHRIGTTVSIGVANFPAEVADASSLLEKADVALYRCKQSGRNRVESYIDEPGEAPADDAPAAVHT